MSWMDKALYVDTPLLKITRDSKGGHVGVRWHWTHTYAAGEYCASDLKPRKTQLGLLPCIS